MKDIFTKDIGPIGLTVYRSEFSKKIEVSIGDGGDDITFDARYIDDLIKLLNEAKKAIKHA
jgi:hypothetical protein